MKKAGPITQESSVYVLRGKLSAAKSTALAILLTLPILASTSSGQVTKLVYSFLGGNSAYPSNVTPTQGRDARLYGTVAGAPGMDGSIFRIATNGSPRPPIALNGSNGSARSDQHHFQRN